MNKQISILILFLLSCLNIIAQSEYAQLKSDIIAHSPEADAMAKYTALPVTLYSGMPNISVPVYSLKTARFNLPISLSYNYNGYKPMEEASSVGLGWSVQGSGVITRIIKGVMDENDASIYHYDDFLNLSMLNFKQEILADIAQGHADAEPDLYIFNFNGHSGKFILVKGKAYLFPAQNLRIDPYGEGFQITTEEGDHYSFQDFEMTYHKNLQGDPYIPTHKSAWYLSQITSADKTDTIN